MSLRRALVLVPLILGTGCADQTRPPASLPPPPLVLEGMPESAARPTPAAAAPVDERFVRERAGWRTSFRLALPALDEPAAHRIRRAAQHWLFQDFEVLPGGVAASGAAALDKLVIEQAVPAGGARALERAVIGVRIGPWLSLVRTLNEPGRDGGASVREDALIVEAANGSALTVDEVVPPVRQAALRSALAAALRSARKLAVGAPLSSGLASDQELPIPLPSLTASGARFVWNPSDLATAAEGAFAVELPRDAVRSLLVLDPWTP
jgi:hypothetical protein